MDCSLVSPNCLKQAKEQTDSEGKCISLSPEECVSLSPEAQDLISMLTGLSSL